jgi:hypothetical protein
MIINHLHILMAFEGKMLSHTVIASLPTESDLVLSVRRDPMYRNRTAML